MEDNQEFIQEENLKELAENQDTDVITDNISYTEFNNDLEPQMANDTEILDENVGLTEGEVLVKKRNKIVDIIWYVFFGVVLLYFYLSPFVINRWVAPTH